ncbi:DUF3102 domain-containing protein [Acinetobacter chengduensis]|uniref:DUF3102 domain-containing protein n=1 Tax=Acinetobacter chengduensis TaxID=2420890 RepID=A0ABX9TRK4_9GAMM|nr:DUF3102 domain-containing protein [Acinetobacter chengduensis]RLL17866.1 DUF3102 domain-containing protein [Acinetobacter chengduensis]
MDLEQQATEITLSEHSQKLGALATQLGYQGALTVGALEDEIRFYQQRTVEACMELGKRLLILKEMTPHGEFNKRIEMLNFTPRMAQKFMSAVLKFSKANSSSLLQKAGNQTKLLELVTLDDDEIDVLEQGGSIGDVSLDTIETMSVRELKKALHDAKKALESKDQDIKAKDQIIQKKDQKANELDEKLTKLNSPAEIQKRTESEPQRLAEKALEEMNKACLTMHNDTVRFTNSINSIVDAINEHELYDIQDRLEANVVALFQQIAQTSVDLGIQIDFQAMVNPSWMSAAPSELEAE